MLGAVGRRQRRRRLTDEPPASTTDYADPDGNVLTLRDSLSEATLAKLARPDTRPGASLEDSWRRRQEMLFERLAVRWEIAGLPLERQQELLGRLRMASADERRWVQETIAPHVERHMPELGG